MCLHMLCWTNRKRWLCFLVVILDIINREAQKGVILQPFLSMGVGLYCRSELHD